MIKEKKYNIIEVAPSQSNLGEAFKISSIPVLIASLCCLSPIILLSFGLVTVSVATELADIFYGTYKWVFRGVGLVALVIFFIFYLRRAGVCTVDDAKRRRNEIINKFILAVLVGVVGYIFFLYVVVHYIGVWLKVWE